MHQRMFAWSANAHVIVGQAGRGIGAEDDAEFGVESEVLRNGCLKTWYDPYEYGPHLVGLRRTVRVRIYPIGWTTVLIQEMNDVDESMYYQCERCGRVKDVPEHDHRRVPPLCSRCRTPMALRVMEQTELGLEFPNETKKVKKGRRARLRVIDGGKA